MAMERAVSDYISTPFYNVFQKPKGSDLYYLCIIQNCREIIQKIAKNMMFGLKILSMDRQCYVHGNIRSKTLFYMHLLLDKYR